MSKGQKITLIIVLVIILGALAYLILFNGSNGVITNNENEGPSGNLPETDEIESEDVLDQEESLIKRLSNQDLDVFSFWKSEDTEELFYITDRGTVLGVGSDSNNEVSSQEISAINRVEVGPGGDLILVSFGDPKNPSWALYDTSDKSWRPFPQSQTIKTMTWGNDEDSLFGIISDSNESVIAEVNLSETVFGNGSLDYSVLVNNFNIKDVTLFKTPESLLIMEKPSVNYGSRIWELNEDNLNISILMESQSGFKSKWEKNSNVVFAINENNQFFILDRNMQSQLSVPFITLPSKCVDSSNHIYCFVPRDFPEENNKAFDDYEKEKIKTNDDLYRINKTSQEIEFINMRIDSQSDLLIDAKSPLYSNGQIYFINRIDNSLYSVDVNTEEN